MITAYPVFEYNNINDFNRNFIRETKVLGLSNVLLNCIVYWNKNPMSKI